MTFEREERDNIEQAEMVKMTETYVECDFTNSATLILSGECINKVGEIGKKVTALVIEDKEFPHKVQRWRKIICDSVGETKD